MILVFQRGSTHPALRAPLLGGDFLEWCDLASIELCFVVGFEIEEMDVGFD